MFEVTIKKSGVKAYIAGAFGFIFMYIFVFVFISLPLVEFLKVSPIPAVIFPFILYTIIFIRYGIGSAAEVSLLVDSDALYLKVDGEDIYSALREDFRKLIINTYPENTEYYLVTSKNTLLIPSEVIWRRKYLKNFIKEIENECTIVSHKTNFWGKVDEEYKRECKLIRDYSWNSIKKVGIRNFYTLRYKIK